MNDWLLNAHRYRFHLHPWDKDYDRFIKEFRFIMSFFEDPPDYKK